MHQNGNVKKQQITNFIVNRRITAQIMIDDFDLTKVKRNCPRPGPDFTARLVPNDWKL